MNEVPKSKKLKRLKSMSNKRRTTSTIVKNTELSVFKSKESISSSFAYYDLQLEKIKVEIQERMKEQKKREEFLHGMLKHENEQSTTEMLTETNRKAELNLPPRHSESVWFCVRKFCCKCFM